MSDSVPQGPVPNPIGLVEPAVTIAGLEGIVVVWFAYFALNGKVFVPVLTDEWYWYYAIFAVFALLGLVIVGMTTEAIAELLERGVTRKWWKRHPRPLWNWYVRAVQLPDDWGAGQRWMWKSEQANKEFVRRRLRLLVARNTATCCLLLAILSIVGILRHPTMSKPFAYVIAGGLVGILVFGLLWLDSHRSWNKAVADAGEIGPP